MSVCYNLNCHNCKKNLWVAQGGANFYYRDKEVMIALGKFLFKHQGHKMSFDSDFKFEDYLGDSED